MPKASVNGIELYYESHGEGPAIVFAHGVGGNHLVWWQQVAHFSRDFRCITFDHRGFGQSAEVPGGPGARAFVDDLAGLLDFLEVEEAFLVAQSMGGRACLGFALAHPHRSIGLVMGCTTGAIGEDKIIGLLKEHKSPTRTEERFASRGFVEREPALTFLFMQMNALNPPRPADFTAIFHTGEGPKADQLAQMEVPTLFISADQDVVAPLHVIRECHKLIPGAKLEVVTGAGHSVYFENPSVFNRLLSEFFSEVLAARQDPPPTS